MAREQVKRKAGAQAAAIGAGALVRDGRIVTDDPWRVLEDDAAIPAQGDIVMRPQRLEEARARNAGRLGVLIAPPDAVEDVAAHLPRLSLVMAAFPSFRDGRAYTTARLLRERYGYQGEVRAVGDVLEDQLFSMLRCGFDSFDLRSKDPEAAFARAAKRFAHVYQPAADARLPAWRRRLLRFAAAPEDAS
ncbi:MAG: DUF934 domain-containing protein [Hyphomonadaceae bacterium]|nr:DUF934 domain-containing protein [Hyphomonadaceae bacterium]